MALPRWREHYVAAERASSAPSITAEQLAALTFESRFRSDHTEAPSSCFRARAPPAQVCVWGGDKGPMPDLKTGDIGSCELELWLIISPINTGVRVSGVLSVSRSEVDSAIYRAALSKEALALFRCLLLPPR